MATDKKSFILYADLIDNIDHLTNEEKGILFTHLLNYVNDKNPVLEDRLILTAWKPIERQLKRDLKKFEEIKEKRSEAGKKSAELRALKKDKQEQQKSTSVESVKQCSTNPTVNVNDNVNENVIYKENVYTKDNFIKNWVEMNNGNSSLKQLSTDDIENFFTLNKLYGKEEFHKALNGMFKQKSLIDTCKSSPKHFLDINNFVKYLDAEKSGNYNLYKSFK